MHNKYLTEKGADRLHFALIASINWVNAYREKVGRDPIKPTDLEPTAHDVDVHDNPIFKALGTKCTTISAKNPYKFFTGDDIGVIEAPYFVAAFSESFGKGWYESLQPGFAAEMFFDDTYRKKNDYEVVGAAMQTDCGRWVVIFTEEKDPYYYTRNLFDHLFNQGQ